MRTAVNTPNGKSVQQLGHFRKITLAKGVTNQGVGNQTTITFDKAPSLVEGMEAAVAALIIRFPSLQIAMGATNTILDGVSLHQLVQLIRLRLSPDSPPSKIGADVLIDGVDGYRALMALSFLSGRRTWRGSGGDQAEQVIATPTSPTSAASMGVAGGLSKNQAVGMLAGVEMWGHCWPMHEGLYGWNSTAGVINWQDAPVLEIPLIPFGGHAAIDGIPLRYFTGERKNGTRVDPGELSITLGSLVDNFAVTTLGTGPQTFSVDALVFVHDPSYDPCPAPLFIRSSTQQSNAFRLSRGTHMLSGFFKKLTAAGNMQTHDYTTVDFRAGGMFVNDSQIVQALEAQNMALVRRGWSIPTITQDATHTAQTSTLNIGSTLRNAAAVRLALPGVPLAWNDSPQRDHSIGDTEEELSVDIRTSGETTFDVLESGYRAVHEDYADHAAVFLGVPGHVSRTVHAKVSGATLTAAQSKLRGAVTRHAPQGSQAAQNLLGARR